MNAVLTSLIRSDLLHVDGVRKLAPARRFASLVTSETAPECLFFLDSGYVKVVRRGADSKEVLLSIIGPGEIFGEHALLNRTPRALPPKFCKKARSSKFRGPCFSAFASAGRK